MFIEINDFINNYCRAINLLILNAATFELDYKCSQDNLEMMYQVNYLSQFYLTRLLMANLREAKDARIIAIGCESYRCDFVVSFEYLSWYKSSYIV